MENRAYAFAFLGVLITICLGAYVSVSLLIENSSELLRINEEGTPTRTATARSIAAAARTPTETPTPFVLIVPTILPSPTATRTPIPTNTPTLPPLPTPRPLPTRTPTPTPDTQPTTDASPQPTTPTNPQPTAPAPPATATARPNPPTATPTIPPGNFLFRQDGPVSPDPNKGCSGQYIYGNVRDASNTPLTGIRIKLIPTFGPPGIPVTKGGSDAGNYDHQIGGTPQVWQVYVVDGADNPLSASVMVNFAGMDSGNCWLRLNWRRVN